MEGQIILYARIKSLIYCLAPPRVFDLFRRAKHTNEVVLSNPSDVVEYPIFGKLLQQGMTVLDIGANHGIYTKLFSQLIGTEGRVISFEPIPVSVKVLKKFVKKAGISNVTVFDIALSDSKGTATMTVPDYKDVPGYAHTGEVYTGAGKNYYAASIITGRQKPDKDSFTVPVNTIDNIVSDLAIKVDFIKCDVEGHELACIRGGLKTIERDHPMLYIEIMDDITDHTSNGYLLVQTLTSLGYLLYVQQGNELHRWAPGIKSINFFFLP